MIIDSIKKVQDYLHNFSGRKISNKVIVFESDDWGSMRMPSRLAFDKLTQEGISLSKNAFNVFDSLETEEDIEALFNVLIKYKDYKGNHPIITANFIMGNPDFEKIAQSDYRNYYFEPFTDSYLSNRGSEDTFYLILRGMSDKLIMPQFHGREHVNVSFWMKLLQEKDFVSIKAFQEKVYCFDILKNKRKNLLAAFDFETEAERQSVIESVDEGLKLFEAKFGFKSRSIIAPCNVWDDSVEQVASNYQVKYIQSLRGQAIPTIENNSKYGRTYHVMGEQNKYGQKYFIRNVYFEPATIVNYPWIKRVLDKIEAAFYFNKPAIISSHRLNYIGSLYPENRKNNLELLNILLSEILKRWPEVAFMSTNELGTLYSNSKENA